MNPIFNRHLQRIRAQRTRVRLSHPLHRFLHDMIHERLSYVLRQFKSVLIIGEFEYQPSPQDCCVIKIGTSVDALSEHLPFKESAFDLIISYMDLHHANDIPGILKQINYCLKPDGLFLGVFLGGNSLWQLRAAAQQAELLTRGGCSPRVAPMISLQDAAALLQRAGFAIPVLDHEPFELEDNNPSSLLHQLKQLQLSNSMYDGFKGLSGKKFLSEVETYLSKKTGIKLDLDILCLSGWAPAANQQKPLPRGSGQKSLAAVLEAN
ncbi:methyltransferase domain-containing protein [Candidatus Odyssella acanthamoebae]|uniref:methyltransferase domain-containing protein n=1 Tax=Candidatus Odyssella acanthamoebae TaxID=91604 RepID=UPI00068C7896|nr:methyltransferase domain-containing protein [Candidatus Paracaedibacter acanthamoebae]